MKNASPGRSRTMDLTVYVSIVETDEGEFGMISIANSEKR